MNRRTGLLDTSADANPLARSKRPEKTGKNRKMTISAQPFGFLADFGHARALRWIVAAAVLTAVAASGTADAKKAHRALVARGGYDGYWNVLIVTLAGPCDQTYSFPVTITGGRILSGGTAEASGRVDRGGGVAVRVSSGGSFATGSGRLGAGFGTGRWIGRGSAGVCSGRWQATRS
jgi:hypothetical protein